LKTEEKEKEGRSVKKRMEETEEELKKKRNRDETRAKKRKRREEKKKINRPRGIFGNAEKKRSKEE
jgi:hypothetical protein